MRTLRGEINNRLPDTRFASVIVLITVGLLGCSGGNSAKQKAAAAKSTETTAVQVSVTPALTGAIRQTALVTGTLTSQDDVVVGVKLAGKVVAVYKREGDPVRSNEVVAQEDPVDYQHQLDQQQANLLAARTRVQQANEQYHQAQVALVNAKTNLTLTDEQTQSSVSQARSALKSAQAQLAITKQGARVQEREQALESVNAAKADRVKARADLTRYQNLYRQNAVSAQQLDQAQAATDSAEARYNSTLQAYNLIQSGNRPEDIQRAQYAVEQANQTLITATSNRSQVSLRREDVQTASAGVSSARAGIAQANAGVAQAEAAVRLARKSLEDTTIRSPIDGVVAERRAEPGQELGAGKDVLRIVSLNSIYFDAQLPESQFSQVRIGQSVAVTVDARPGRTYQGTVRKLFPVASSGARSFTVRIALANERQDLRPAMFARGSIVLETHPHATLVPRDAVLDVNGNEGRLFVIRKNVAEERKVTLGFSDGLQTEIAAGIERGELVVILGQAQLQNDTPVKITQPGNAGQ